MVQGISEPWIRSLNNNKCHMNLQISHMADFNTSVAPFAVVDVMKKTFNLQNRSERQ